MDLNLSSTLPTEADSILVPTGEDGVFNFRCDNSTLEKFQYCQREGQYYVWERRTGATTSALNLGSALHNAWELLYLHGFSHDTLELCQQKIIDHYNLFPITDEWRTCEFALNVIQRYYEHYSDSETLLPITHNGNLFVENAFEIKMGEIEVNDTIICPIAGPTFVKKLMIYWIGKIDIATSFMGGVWALDHKTTSRLGNTFWDKFQISSQMLGYNWALWKILGELPKGVILNVAALRKPTKTGKCVEFMRQTYPYTEEQILEWKEDTLTSISDFISSSIRNYFPPSKCNCIRVYGKCGYFDVCSLAKSSRKLMLKSSNYVPVTWDPTKEG